MICAYADSVKIRLMQMVGEAFFQSSRAPARRIAAAFDRFLNIRRRYGLSFSHWAQNPPIECSRSRTCRRRKWLLRGKPCRQMAAARRTVFGRWAEVGRQGPVLPL